MWCLFSYIKSKIYNVNPMFICKKDFLSHEFDIESCLWYLCMLWTTILRKKPVQLLYVCVWILFKSISFLLSVLTFQDCFCPFSILLIYCSNILFGLGNHVFPSSNKIFHSLYASFKID